MTKVSDLVQTYSFQGVEIDVFVGEVVWWWPQGQTTGVPMVAFLTALGDEGMVSLRYFQPNSSVVKEADGIVMLGDVRLKNEHVRKRGAWCPRATWDVIQSGA